MIDRRAFVSGATAAGLLWSTRAVGAPAGTKVYRIGVLDQGSNADWTEFVAELARRGYSERRNLVLERRFVDYLRPDLLSRVADELVALKVDLLYATGGTATALAAKNATKSIPIVFYSSADPVGLGLVASLSRPGANVTGSSISGFDSGPKGLQFLVEVVGKRNVRIAYIQPRGTRSLPWFPKWAAAMTAAASQLGTQFEYVDVDSIAEIDLVLKRLVREGVEAVIFPGFPMLEPHQRQIAGMLVDHRLPSIGDAHAGFLLEYQFDPLQLARKAAENVDKILSGASPADLPVEQASTFRLVVNEKTAKAIGLQLPPSILQRADEVIR